MLVKPAPGLQVRDPRTRQFIDHGADLDPDDLTIARLLRDEDLIPLDEAEIAAFAAAQAAAEAAARAAAEAEAKAAAKGAKPVTPSTKDA